MNPHDRNDRQPSSSVYQWQTEKPKRRKTGLGIRPRLVLLIVAATIVVIGISGTLSTRENESSMFEAEKERAGAFLESLSLPCAISVANNALERLDNFMSESVRNPSPNTRLISLKMLDHNGHTIMDARSGDSNRTDTKTIQVFTPTDVQAFTALAHKSDQPVWVKKTPQRAASILMMSMPAVSGLRWGTLIASFNLATYDARVIRLRYYSLASNLALILALILVLYLGVSILVVSPIHELNDSMTQIQKGALSTRVQTKMGGEMHDLANGFNAMADEIESYTKTLERKVEDRSQEVRLKAQELEQVNTQLHQAVSKLETLVKTDELTGIHNRRYLTEILQIETKRSARTGRPLTLAMIDVDHFKILNDRFGHAVGDHVLTAVARILQDKLRSTDVVARFGGEEFVVMFFDTPKTTAHTVAEGLRETIEHAELGTNTIKLDRPVTVSIGLASCPEDGGDASVLLEKADEAMYAAKKAGRNQVVLWKKEHES